MNNMKLQKTLNLVSKIVFNVMAVILGLTILVSVIITNESVSGLLTDFVFKDRPDNVVVNTGKEPVRYKTWYSSVENELDGNAQIARLVQAEGSVLLKNKDKALPLKDGEKISLYGVTAYDPMYSQDGAGNSKINDPQSYSGTKSQINRRQFFYDELIAEGFTVNEKLQAWYNSDEGKYYRRVDTIGFWGSDAGNGIIPALSEADWSEIPADVKDTDTYGKDTTAVFVTGRMTNEILDLNSEGAGSTKTDANKNNDGTKGNTDYLKFTAEEKNLMRELGNNYDKFIVILNQANAPQEDLPALFEQYNVDAVLWIGFPGSDGIRSVARILSGKINPSGGMSAGWYTARENNPSSQNFGFNTANVVNVEGMYMGWRYAETRYEDTLYGNSKAGDYDYDASVSYPFGYGLSYTTFEYTNIELVKDEDPEKNYYTGGLMAANDPNYTGNYGKKRPNEELRATGDNLGDCDDLIMKVTVKNNGEVAGKEIVQVYLQQPISDTDREHGVQKPAVQLVGFGKTDILEAGAEGTVEIKIDANKWFAAYDSRIENKQGGYVLTAGDYKLVVARNSHEAVNSLYKANGGDTTNAKFDDDYGAGSASNVKTVSVSDSRAASYKYWTQGTTDDVHNLFADIDPNMDDLTSNDVLYFSRYDWETTAKKEGSYIGQDGRNKTGAAYGQTSDFHSKGTLNSAKIDKFEQYYNVDFNDAAYTFGWSDTDYQLADLIGVEYDPARGASDADVQKWRQFVGQMSANDMKTLFSNGRRRTVAVPSIGKPATSDENASNGFEWLFAVGKDSSTNYGYRNKFDDKAKTCYPTGYPCESTVGATFNYELAYLVGQALGEDALWTGASGLYGFGLGMQRNPYHGRTGEYYSDDPYLTGIMGGYATKGAQEKGLYVYNKHFVLNDQETNRGGFSAWLDEQTFRQIYLRPFEMAIEIGDAMNVMIAFNKLGSAWTGSHYNLMERWLHGEAGMAGFAVSDWAPSDGEQLGYGILAGSDLLDGPAEGYSAGVDARYDNRLVDAAIQILYTTANSNVMNFIGDDVKIYTFDPLWYATRDALVQPISITVYVLFGLSAAFALGVTAWKVVVDILAKKKS